MKIIALAALLCLAACADSTPVNADNEPRAQREYPTGSNIPRKSRDTDATVYDREAVERAQSSSHGGDGTMRR